MEDRKRSAAASTSSTNDEDDDHSAENERLTKRLAVQVAGPDVVDGRLYLKRSPLSRRCCVLRSVQMLPPLSEKRKQEVWQILHQDLPTVDNNNIVPLEKLADLCTNEYLGYMYSYKGEDYAELSCYDDRHYEGDASIDDYNYDWSTYEFDLLSLGYHSIGVAYKVFVVKNGGVALINHTMKRFMKQDNNNNNNNRNNNRVLGEVIRCVFHLIPYSHDQSVPLGVVESVIQVMNNYAEDEYIQVYGCGFLDKYMFCCENFQEESIVINNNGIAVIVNAMERWPGNKILQKWACQALATICITDYFVGDVFKARGLGAVARVVENNEFDSHTTKFALATLEKLFPYASQRQQQQPRKYSTAVDRGVSVSCCDKEAPGDNGDDDENDDDTSYIPSSDDEDEDDDIVYDNDDSSASDDEDICVDNDDEENEDNNDNASDDEDDNNLVSSRWQYVLRSSYPRRSSQR